MKPAGSARLQLFLAATMWTAVGAALAGVGVHWLLPERAWLLASAGVLGLLKARFILRRAADSTAARIRERGDGRCIGGFLSVRSWLFVILMAATGRLLRSAPIPRAVIGCVYVAVGLALLVACVRLWRAWRREGRAGDPVTESEEVSDDI